MAHSKNVAHVAKAKPGVSPEASAYSSNQTPVTSGKLNRSPSGKHLFPQKEQKPEYLCQVCKQQWTHSNHKTSDGRRGWCVKN